MPIRSPYGVGIGSQPARTVGGHCRCCEFPFKYEQLPAQPEVRHYCVSCVDHYQIASETVDRELARLRAHAPALREHADHYRAYAERTAGDARRAKERMDSALYERDRWQAVATAAIDEHRNVGKLCGACKSKWPCNTLDAMLGVDMRLVHRIIDQLGRGDERDRAARQLWEESL